MAHIDNEKERAANARRISAGLIRNQREEAFDMGVYQIPEHPCAHDLVSAALSHMDARAATYDAPSGERSMAKTVGMFNVLTGAELTEEQGWLFMALLKIVRSTQGDFKADNYEDLAAYAGLAGESAAKARS